MRTSHYRFASSRLAIIVGTCFITGSFIAERPAAADSDPAADQAGAELKEHHRHHHHGGITKFIAMSLDAIGTDDAKRPQIEKVQSDLHTCMAPVADIEKGLLSTLADGVAAGAIDTAKVDAAIAQLDTAATKVQGCSVDALNRLHAILSPAERAALVDKIQAHWEVWQQVNHKAEPGGREKGGRLAEFATELKLSSAQVDKMSTALHAASGDFTGKFDPKSGEAHMHAFTTAFVADTFDAKSVTLNTNGDLATHGAKRMALFYETVTPLLTAAQRTKLAAHLREHASHQPAHAGK